MNVLNFYKRISKGFTLIELSIVLIIAAILTSLALPYFWSAYSSMELKGSARIVTSVLRDAKSYAECQNVTYEVNLHIPSNPGNDNELHMTIYKDPKGTPVQVGKVEKLSLGAQVEFSTTFVTNLDADTDADVYFKPHGTCNGGKVIIKNTDRSEKIEITILPATARVKISEITTY